MSDFSLRITDGVNINKLTDKIINKYDANQDKEIDIATESSIVFHGPPAPGSDSVLLTRDSMAPLFKDADKAGNNDGKVNRMELYEFIEKFDEGKDGDLDARPLLMKLFKGDGELEKFEKNYSEIKSYQQKNIT